MKKIYSVPLVIVVSMTSSLLFQYIVSLVAANEDFLDIQTAVICAVFPLIYVVFRKRNISTGRVIWVAIGFSLIYTVVDYFLP